MYSSKTRFKKKIEYISLFVVEEYPREKKILLTSSLNIRM